MVCAKEISGMGTGTSMNYMYGYGFTGSAMGMNATHDEVCERPKTPDEKKEVEQFREPGQQKIMANAQATEANEKVRESRIAWTAGIVSALLVATTAGALIYLGRSH
jgi:hypothetical protein